MQKIQILQKIQIYFLLSKSVFCGNTYMIITHLLYNPKMEWWFIKLHSYIMSNKAEPFNLIQIFPLLHLAPDTFRPLSPKSSFHGFWQSFLTIGSCNHLMGIISTYVAATPATQRKSGLMKTVIYTSKQQSYLY